MCTLYKWIRMCSIAFADTDPRTRFYVCHVPLLITFFVMPPNGQIVSCQHQMVCVFVRHGRTESYHKILYIQCVYLIASPTLHISRKPSLTLSPNTVAGDECNRKDTIFLHKVLVKKQWVVCSVNFVVGGFALGQKCTWLVFFPIFVSACLIWLLYFPS